MFFPLISEVWGKKVSNMIKALAQYWWLIAARGILAVIFGLLAIAYPFKTATFVALVVGLFIMIDGIIQGITSLTQIKKDEHWWVLLFKGILGLMIGLAIFSWPGLTIKVLFFLVSIWMIFVGVLLLVMAFVVRKETEMEWFIAANGIISLFLGFFFYSSPEITFALMSIIIGLFALISGIITTALGIKLQSYK